MKEHFPEIKLYSFFKVKDTSDIGELWKKYAYLVKFSVFKRRQNQIGF
jgi:oligoribonuclease (3'-5' exoribonuclease)